MLMKRKGLVITIFVFLLMLNLLLLNVALVNADFVLTSEQDSGEICKGRTLLWVVDVAGSGGYTTSLEGGGSAFAVAVPSGFLSLDKKAVYVYLTPNS